VDFAICWQFPRAEPLEIGIAEVGRDHRVAVHRRTQFPGVFDTTGDHRVGVDGTRGDLAAHSLERRRRARHLPFCARTCRRAPPEFPGRNQERQAKYCQKPRRRQAFFP
jgi:hypothetical protein